MAGPNAIILNGSTSGSLTLTPPAAANNIQVQLPSTSGVVSASNRYRWYIVDYSVTYTVPPYVKAFYVFITGATGGALAGASGNYFGGGGGSGYSEKYYSNPVAGTIYTFTSGAAGTTSGTNGGTTTFDVISITGSGGVTNSAGGAGGVATGGDFNANGGAGGAGTASAAGGGGGPGTRAGNGGTGGTPASTTGGGGGGPGGANASGSTGGSGTGIVTSGSALVLPWISPSNTETFYSGASGSGTSGGAGAYTNNIGVNYHEMNCPLQWNTTINNILLSTSTPSARSLSGGTTGSSTAYGGGYPGQMMLCEILK